MLLQGGNPMIRVTNNLLKNNLLHNLHRQNNNIESLQRHLSDGNRIHSPHEDPVGTATSLIYRSKIQEYNRYGVNIQDGIDRLSFIDVKLQEVKTYLDRIRELAVQGSNGVYTQPDMQIMGKEVEQFLRQIIMVSNSKLRGESVFSGFDTEKDPFRVATNIIQQFGEAVVTNVEYEGDIGENFREIDRGEYIPINLPGNNTFWASNQRISSQTPATGFVAQSDQWIRIDGTSIKITKGDNLESIVNKINNSGLSVRAEINNISGNNYLVLQTTSPHQMWLEDTQGGTVLQDLGIIAVGGAYPPGNYAPSAIVEGDSLFDKVMQVRDGLLQGDIQAVNRGIGGIDEAINVVMNNLATVGARQSRMETVNERVSQTAYFAQEAYSKVQDLDMAKAMSELKYIEFSQRAALQIGARIIPPSLLDYLR